MTLDPKWVSFALCLLHVKQKLRVWEKSSFMDIGMIFPFHHMSFHLKFNNFTKNAHQYQIFYGLSMTSQAFLFWNKTFKYCESVCS